MKIIFTIFFIFYINIVESQQTESFQRYIANFERVQSDTISRNDFKPEKSISYEFLQKYIPIDQDCECEKLDLQYRYVSVIEKNDYIVAIVYRYCESPPVGFYLYHDEIIVVYSKEGGIIDSKIISRNGYLWYSNYSGTWSPFMLQVEQASVLKEEIKLQKKYPCTIDTYLYTIDIDGKINEELLSKGINGYIKLFRDVEGLKKQLEYINN